ncbi:MAG: PD-(D/E)XK nuclease family protein [Vicinamibacteria bacterium]
MTNALVEQLEAAIRDLRRDDAFRPIEVIVPTPLLGQWLSRRIFADSGHFAVRLSRAEDLAWRILEPEALATGERPAPEFAELAMILAALREEAQREDLPAYLKAAIATRGFAPAALRTLRDLDAAGVAPEALGALAPTSAAPERLQLLARLARGLRERLAQARLVPRAALFRRAAEAAGEQKDVSAVVVTPLDDPSPAITAFLAGLAKHCDVRRLAAPDGEPPALKQMKVLAASGEHLEAVEIARLILEAIDDDPGLGYGDVAVLMRNAGPAAAALDAAFERAGIPALFLEGTPRVDAAARALSLLLDLLDRDFERARVMEFLTTAQAPWDEILGEDAEPSAAGWDRLTARAGIVSGLAEWRTGLDRAEENARAMAERYERDPDDERDVRLIGGLRRVIEQLATDFAGFPEDAGWGTYLDATLALLARWIRGGAAVRERLERALRPLAAHAPAPRRAEFVARVQDLLASQTYREGELGEARVFVGSIEAAAGLRFRRVFVPGLAERRFPAPVRPDPLLLDDERRALDPALHTTVDGLAKERRLFENALHAATEGLVMSWPRVDASGNDSVPSSFLLEATSRAKGRALRTADLLALADGGATVLGRAWPDDPAVALDLLERDLSLVSAGRKGAARHLLDDAPHLARALRAEAASFDRGLTEWDGVLDLSDATVAAWAAGLRLEGTASATRVQNFASCPYRHFLDRGLRLNPWEEPGRVYQPDAKQRGSIYHEALERLFRELAEQKALPVTAENLSAAQALARRVIATVLDEAAAEGVVVHRSLLDPLEIDMVRDLDETLRVEAGSDDGFVPSEFEKEFSDVAFAFGDGREVRFRGKLDRVDLAKNPDRVRVVDYKTGGYYYDEGEDLKGGTEVQLVLYNLAAESLYPNHEVTRAVYRYATEKGGFQDKACENTHENRATLRTVLENLDQLAQAGVFPPVADNCLFCDYKDLCGPWREQRARRKTDDPRLAPIKTLRQIK